jgi:hypothetical protein
LNHPRLHIAAPAKILCQLIVILAADEDHVKILQGLAENTPGEQPVRQSRAVRDKAGPRRSARKSSEDIAAHNEVKLSPVRLPKELDTLPRDPQHLVREVFQIVRST